MKIIRAGVLGGHYVPGVTAGVKISGKVREGHKFGLLTYRYNLSLSEISASARLFSRRKQFFLRTFLGKVIKQICFLGIVVGLIDKRQK